MWSRQALTTTLSFTEGSKRFRALKRCSGIMSKDDTQLTCCSCRSSFVSLLKTVWGIQACEFLLTCFCKHIKFMYVIYAEIISIVRLHKKSKKMKTFVNIWVIIKSMKLRVKLKLSSNVVHEIYGDFTQSVFTDLWEYNCTCN